MHHRLATFLCLEWALVHSTRAQGLSSFREFDGQTSVVAIDGSTAYLAGSQHLLISGASQAFLRKIDAEGNTLWSRQFGEITCGLARKSGPRRALRAIAAGKEPYELEP